MAGPGYLSHNRIRVVERTLRLLRDNDGAAPTLILTDAATDIRNDFNLREIPRHGPYSLSPTTMFLLRQAARRTRHLSSSALNRPAPPPLPPRQQREFEELVRAAGTPAASTDSSIASEAAVLQARIAKGEELHPDARRTPPAEFEGDTNPVTGEVGGPKREPVRHGDWSYSGRASDF